MGTNFAPIANAMGGPKIKPLASIPEVEHYHMLKVNFPEQMWGLSPMRAIFRVKHAKKEQENRKWLHPSLDY